MFNVNFTALLYSISCGIEKLGVQNFIECYCLYSTEKYNWLDESDLMLLYINLCQVFIIKNNNSDVLSVLYSVIIYYHSINLPLSLVNTRSTSNNILSSICFVGMDFFLAISHWGWRDVWDVTESLISSSTYQW